MLLRTGFYAVLIQPQSQAEPVQLSLEGGPFSVLLPLISVIARYCLLSLVVGQEGDSCLPDLEYHCLLSMKDLNPRWFSNSLSLVEAFALTILPAASTMWERGCFCSSPSTLLFSLWLFPERHSPRRSLYSVPQQRSFSPMMKSQMSLGWASRLSLTWR